MIIQILGIFHLIHSPLLILLPFLIQNFTLDIIYLIYFFFIMFLYTFIDGECPISYICKIISDKNYIAGNNITYYPEMEYILSNKIYIDYYFGIMTIMYILTLFFVIFRTNIFFYTFSFPFLILFIYFLFIRNIFLKKKRNNFYNISRIYKIYIIIYDLFFININSFINILMV